MLLALTVMSCQKENLQTDLSEGIENTILKRNTGIDCTRNYPFPTLDNIDVFDCGAGRCDSRTLCFKVGTPEGKADYYIFVIDVGYTCLSLSVAEPFLRYRIANRFFNRDIEITRYAVYQGRSRVRYVKSNSIIINLEVCN